MKYLQNALYTLALLSFTICMLVTGLQPHLDFLPRSPWLAGKFLVAAYGLLIIAGSLSQLRKRK